MFIHLDLGFFLGPKHPILTRPDWFSQFFEKAKKRFWTQQDPIPNIDFVGLSVDPCLILSVGKVGETLDSHLDIFFFGLQ
jgi:hypothetical protein